jgi:CubicO group peptidase (beta-lactamase class C family)
MKRPMYILALIFAGTSVLAQTYSNEILGKIKAVENGLNGRVKIEGKPDFNITERLKHYKVKGLSIAVVHNYKVEWAKGYGWADESKKLPVTTATLFEPGSISKSLNAVGVLKLVQDGKLDLHADINTYLKSWKFPYDSLSTGKKITLAHILSHSAGLGQHGFPGYERDARIPTVQQVLDGVPPANTGAVRSLFEPGLKFKYSGGGTTISQLIVSDVTNQPYHIFMYDNVLKPMGMVNSSYQQPPAKEKLKFCATGYSADGEPVKGNYHVYPEQAAAGLWMTPSDLCNYIIETQLAYEGKSSKVLNQEMTKLRLTPYNNESSALGVFVEDHDGAKYFQHGAGNEGFRGIYYGSLEGGEGVAVFVNSDNGNIITEVVNSVAAAYGWKNFYKPVYKTEVTVPENVLQTYQGIYIFEGGWSSILKHDGKWCMFVDGIYAEMHFTAPDAFFNVEFLSEKRFIKNENGGVTGYERFVEGKSHPSAIRITAPPDTLQLDPGAFNWIAWHLLENKRPEEAKVFLEYSLQKNPDQLIELGNLAHCYLFTNNYADAMNIYKAHLKETLYGDFTWQDMIKEDFTFFKKHGYQTKEMDKVFSELKINKPDGY